MQVMGRAEVAGEAVPDVRRAARVSGEGEERVSGELW